MRTLRHLACAVFFGALLSLAAHAAVEAKKSYAIPAGEAAAALKQFSATSGRETLFAAEAVRGVKTPAVKGELTVQEALDALLDGTGLVASVDAKTGAIAVRRESSGETKNALGRPADAVAANSDASSRTAGVRVEEGVVKLEQVEVTGSRIPLNSGERPAQPVLTFSAEDMTRKGMARLGDLFQYIPSVTGFSTGLGTEINSGVQGLVLTNGAARTSAQLRGGKYGATLLLVDGKRVPFTSQQAAGGQGLDLGGIPLSAVERVEVLLDGASSIYGADAINGVINVILKKSYSGTELHLNYDNTFDKDAGVLTTSLTHGFARGKFSGLVTLSSASNTIMLLADRPLTATYDRTLFGGTLSQGNLFYGDTGTLRVSSGNLPGLSTNIVAIPKGSTGENVSVADYVAAGTPVPGRLPVGRTGAMAYNRERSGYVRLNYEFSDHLTLTGYVRLGESDQHDNGNYRRAQNTQLPAGYPGNPFGVTVLLNKIFYDVTPEFFQVKTRNHEFALSGTGQLAGDWRYEAAVNYVRGLNQSVPFRIDGVTTGINGSLTLDSGTFAAARAAGRQPPLAYDSRTGTRDPNAIVDLFFNNSPFKVGDLVQTWTYSASANGPVFELPAGKVHAAAGLERREEYIAFPGALGSGLGATAWTDVPQRNVTAEYAEVKIPLVSPKQKLVLVHKLEASAAVRTEEYSDVGRSTTPRYGLMWQPHSRLTLRASYGEGFLVPLLDDIKRPANTLTLPWFSSDTPIDTLRGNQSLLGQTYVTVFGGNPNLKPQRSEHRTFGFILYVPRVEGLSISVDWFDNRYRDNFGLVDTLPARIQYLPQTITRGPNLPGDQPGWAGPIIQVDSRIQNIAESRFAGYNFGVRWSRATRWGDFTFNSSGEKTLTDEKRVVPGATPSATTNKRYRPLRVTTSLFWERQAWEVGVTNIYGGRYWADSFNTALSASRYTDPVMRWDVRASYDFGRVSGFGERGSSWWRRALHGTKWSATVINLANAEPSLDANGNFTSDVLDPRLRRYVIDITKRF